jgi:hypothetical protein
MALNFYLSLLPILNAPDAHVSVGWSYPCRYGEQPLDGVAFGVGACKK